FHYLISPTVTNQGGVELVDVVRGHDRNQTVRGHHSIQSVQQGRGRDTHTCVRLRLVVRLTVLCRSVGVYIFQQQDSSRLDTTNQVYQRGVFLQVSQRRIPQIQSELRSQSLNHRSLTSSGRPVEEVPSVIRDSEVDVLL